MTILVLGLLVFLGSHSIRIFAEPWRTAQVARLGEMSWKLAYTVVSLVGFALLVWGFGLARQGSYVVWTPPFAMRHIAALLTLIAFIFLVATYVPRNGIKARFHHPMTLAVTIWAFAHILANGKLADMILFGSFLIWAKLSFLAARKRDRIAGTKYPAGTLGATVFTIMMGILAWAVFALWLHRPLIGVQPLT
ncbi:MAG: protein NrnU [Herminiimonas sp.]|nr:protein NrnU [Herminiimonas sp.]